MSRDSRDFRYRKCSGKYFVRERGFIEPTRMYVSTSEFSPNPTIDYWEEV